MAEEMKKKRGRPPKKKPEETIASNEQTTQVKMTVTDVKNEFLEVFRKYKGHSQLTYADYLSAYGNSFKK